MSSNNRIRAFFASPEQTLALQITGTIGGILLIVMAIVFAALVRNNAGKELEFFRAREAAMNARPNFLERQMLLRNQDGEERREMRTGKNAEKERPERERERNFAPGLRNVIVIPSISGKANGSASSPPSQTPTKAFALGPLENANLDAMQLSSIPERNIVTIGLEGEEFMAYAFSRADGSKIIMYEPVGLLRTQQKNLAGSLAVLVIVFTVLLYGVSYRIALRTIRPIREQSEKERAYARHIAHELKTPLAIVSSDLELIEAMPTLAKERLPQSRWELRELAHTVDDLLAFSVGEHSIDKKPTPLLPIIRHAIDSLGKSYGDRNITWSLPTSDRKYDLDERLVRTLVRNLVKNAFVHGRPGSQAMVQFSDSYVSISNEIEHPESVPPTLFTAFSGTPGKGSGIGLSLVKSIVETHGWNITAEKTDSHLTIRIGMGKESGNALLP